MPNTNSKITLEELQNMNVQIDKKYLLIDSSIYTDKAYEYLLSLVDQTESIAFIYDRRLIYAQGKYFGSDIWKESLMYFGNLTLVDPLTGEDVTTVSAEYMNENLRIKTDGTIKIETEEEFKGGLSLKSLKFSFDLKNTINDENITLTNGEQISLNCDSGKIKLINYKPISVKADNPELIELDSSIEEISIPLIIEGTNPIKELNVYTSPVQDYRIDENNILHSTISLNKDQYFTISYNDGEEYGVLNIIQRYGVGLFYSTTEINNSNYMDCNRVLSYNSCDCEFILNQTEDRYGYFACPSDYKPIFKDEKSGFVGGWKKVRDLYLYSIKKNYTLYRTENGGLGKNKWIVSEIKY